MQHGRTGLVAEPGDATDLARVLTQALVDPDAWFERTEAGRDLVTREYDVRRSADALAALFSAAAR